MNDIIIKATDYRKDVARRAVAHELSGEYHRHRGVPLGIAATVVSAIVGSAIFITITAKLGFDGGSTISIPSRGWTLLAFIGFGLLSILAPILTGLQSHLNHPGQAEKHRASSADYYRLQQRLDFFLSRYHGENFKGEMREDALKELNDISREIETAKKISISLTAKAYEHADRQLN